MNDALVKNSADKEQVKKAAETERRKELDETEDLRWVLNDKRGRRFLWKTLSGCNAFHSGFSENQAIMAFTAGKREVGLKLLAQINTASKDAYLLMIKENQEGG